MSEKRFECVFKEHETKNSWSMIKDNQLDGPLYIKDVVDLLNEQQATIIELQEMIIDLKDDKNQLHKVISKLRQEVAELKTRNAVLSSKLNQIPKSIREVWLDE